MPTQNITIWRATIGQPLHTAQLRIEDPCSDSTALGHEQIGLELTAERLGPNGARRSQAAGNALAFAVQASIDVKLRPIDYICISKSHLFRPMV